MSQETEDQTLFLPDIVEAQLHNTVAASGSFLSIAQADFYLSESCRGASPRKPWACKELWPVSCYTLGGGITTM